MGLTNYQYNQIIRQYDDIRSANAGRLEDRKSEIRRKLPEYAELEREIVDLSISCATRTLSSDAAEAAANIAALDKELGVLAEKKKAILVRAGYPVNYLEAVYSCPDCKDTGYIGNRRCHCFKQAVADLIYRQSNLKGILERENFESFSMDFYSKTCIDPVTGESSYDIMKGNYEKAQRFVKEFGTKREAENLILYGTAGLGKTFLSNCIAGALLEKGVTVLYLTSHSFFEALARDMRRNDDPEEGLMSSDYILTSDLLIIDDLGAELSTAFTVSKFNYCLNERLLRNKATILSTNLMLDAIEGVYGDRNFSRIIGNFTPLYFYGDDIRIQKQLSVG